jgi:hypothetical protein
MIFLKRTPWSSGMYALTAGILLLTGADKPSTGNEPGWHSLILQGGAGMGGREAQIGAKCALVVLHCRNKGRTFHLGMTSGSIMKMAHSTLYARFPRTQRQSLKLQPCVLHPGSGNLEHRCRPIFLDALLPATSCLQGNSIAWMASCALRLMRHKSAVSKQCC